MSPFSEDSRVIKTGNFSSHEQELFRKFAPCLVYDDKEPSATPYGGLYDLLSITSSPFFNRILSAILPSSPDASI